MPAGGTNAGKARLRILAPNGTRELELSYGSHQIGSHTDCAVVVEALADFAAILRIEENGFAVEQIGEGPPPRVDDTLPDEPGIFAYPGSFSIDSVRLEVNRIPEETLEQTVHTGAATVATAAGTLKPKASITHAAATKSTTRDRYERGDEIARGGMGTVWEARETSLDRMVAMKTILGKQGSLEARARFIREATVLGRLEHPNIVPIYELGTDANGRLFYTMKKVVGRTLKEILSDLQRGDSTTLLEFKLEQLLSIFRKICDAVAYAHSRGVIHRDLKPENIMVGAFGEVLVMDWGLAKLSSEDLETDPLPGAFHPLTDDPSATSQSDITLAGTVMGSPRYMSPEQAAGQGDQVDARSDIFSLGGILYAILTLQPPISGSTISEVLMNVRSGDIAPPTQVRYQTRRRSGPPVPAPDAKRSGDPLPHCPGGRVPEAMSAVAMKALEYEPDERYQEVSEFSADVAAYQAGFATSVAQLGTIGLLRLWIARNRGIAATATILLLIIVGIWTDFTFDLKEKSRIANTAADDANLAKLKAEAAEVRSREERNHALRALSLSKIALADAALSNRDTDTLLRHLFSVPEEHRDQEWAYLLKQGDNSSHTVYAPRGRKFTRVAACAGIPGLFALGDEGGGVTLLDARTGRKLGALVLPSKALPSITALAFTEDGKALAVGGGTNLTVYSLPWGKLKSTWNLDGNQVDRIVYDPRGDRVLLGFRNGLTQLRSAADGRILATQPERYPLDFSSNGHLMVTKVPATSRNGDRVFLQSNSLEATAEIRLNGRPTDAAFHPNKPQLITVNVSGQIAVWNTAEQTKEWEMGTDLRDARLFFSTRPPAEFLIVFGRASSGRQEGRIYDTKRKRLHQNLFGLNAEFKDVSRRGSMLEDVAFSQSSGHFVAVSGVAKIWNIPMHDELLTMEKMRELGFGFTTDHQIWRSPQGDRQSQLVDLQERAVIPRVADTFHAQLVRTSRDGKRAITASAYTNGILKPMIRFWNHIGSPPLELPFRGRILEGGVDFSAIGHQALAGRYDSVCQVYDTRNGTLRRSIDTRQLGQLFRLGFVGMEQFFTVHHTSQDQQRTSFQLTIWNTQGKNSNQSLCVSTLEHSTFHPMARRS